MIVSIVVVFLLGVLLMYDFCYISFSDLLILWLVIEKCIVVVGEVDFVICFYNLCSCGCEGYLVCVFDLFVVSKSVQMLVGVVKFVGCKKEEKWLIMFGDMDFELVDMISLVIVGNKMIYVQDGLMIML